MRLPLNAIHWYIGWPFLIIVAVRSFMVRGNSLNTLNTLFGLSAVTFMLSFTAYGLAPLLTESSSVLTYATIVGDAFQFVALFWLWIAVARIYFPGRVTLHRVFIGLDFIIVLVGIAFSIKENLAQPVTMSYIDGAWQINYAFSFGYQVATAIQYVSLLLLAARFWAQSRTAKLTSQKIRLRSFAALFLIIGGVFVLRPFFNIDVAQNSLSYVMAAALLMVGIFITATIFLAGKGKQA